MVGCLYLHFIIAERLFQVLTEKLLFDHLDGFDAEQLNEAIGGGLYGLERTKFYVPLAVLAANCQKLIVVRAWREGGYLTRTVTGKKELKRYLPSALLLDATCIRLPPDTVLNTSRLKTVYVSYPWQLNRILPGVKNQLESIIFRCPLSHPPEVKVVMKGNKVASLLMYTKRSTCPTDIFVAGATFLLYDIAHNEFSKVTLAGFNSLSAMAIRRAFSRTKCLELVNCRGLGRDNFSNSIQLCFKRKHRSLNASWPDPPPSTERCKRLAN